MATFGTPTTAASASGSTFTFSHTVTADADCLYVAMSLNGDAGMARVTYGGVEMTLVSSVLYSAGGTVVELWELVGPVAGTANVYAEVSGGASVIPAFAAWDAYDCGGVRTGSVATNQGSGGPPSPTVSVAPQAGDTVMDVVGTNNSSGRTLTAGAGQTEIVNYNRNSTTFGIIAASHEPGASLVDMTWTGSGGFTRWMSIGVSLMPASGGSTADTLTAAYDAVAATGYTATLSPGTPPATLAATYDTVAATGYAASLTTGTPPRSLSATFDAVAAQGYAAILTPGARTLSAGFAPVSATGYSASLTTGTAAGAFAATYDAVSVAGYSAALVGSESFAAGFSAVGVTGYPAAIQGAAVLGYLTGTLTLRPALDASLALSPALSGTPDLTPALAGTLALTPRE